MAQDAGNTPTSSALHVSNTSNGDESYSTVMSNSSTSSNHSLRFDNELGAGSYNPHDLKYSGIGLTRPTVTVRRYVPGTTSGMFTTTQQSYGHLNQKQQSNIGSNFLYKTRHRNSPSSQMLLAHLNTSNIEGLLIN